MRAVGRRGWRRWWAELDHRLWGIPLGIVLVAGILIASTQRQARYADWYDHWITAGVGMAVALLLARIPLQRLRPLLQPLYALTVISLIAVRFVGTSALGAQRWINIAGFHVQPSEFAKLAAILLLAGVLARFPVERPVDLIRPTALITLPWLLVFIQPDLGTSLVFGAIWIVMLYWAGMAGTWVVLLLSPLVTAILAGAWPWGLLVWLPLLAWLAWTSLPWKRIALGLALGVNGLFALITPYLWMHGLAEYQRQRLVLFLDPSQDPLGGGYHLVQSQIGIGSGGFWGTGLLHGYLTRLRFIPEQHTDFIFSAMGEETGFVGSLLLIVAYVVLLHRLLQIAGRARSDFMNSAVSGLSAILASSPVMRALMAGGRPAGPETMYQVGGTL